MGNELFISMTIIKTTLITYTFFSRIMLRDLLATTKTSPIQNISVLTIP